MIKKKFFLLVSVSYIGVKKAVRYVSIPEIAITLIKFGVEKKYVKENSLVCDIHFFFV